MFVMNFKLDFKKIFIICLIIAVTFAILVEVLVKKDTTICYDYTMTAENFIEILDKVHNNIDMNIGKNIVITGFIYRLNEFDNNTFVCGRNIIVDGEENIAGFLCTSEKSKNFLDGEWVEIVATIEKTDFNGPMPILKVKEIKKVTAPPVTFVE